MKQDRKWFKNQIEIMGTETSESYPHEQMVDREVVLKLADQLDEPEITEEQAWEVLAPRFSMTAEELERQVLDGFLAMTMEEIEMESNKIKQLAVGIKLLHAENEELKAKLNGQDSPTSQEEAIWVEEAAERLGISIVEKPIIPQFVADWWECDGDSVKLYGGVRVKKKHKFDLVSNFHDTGLGDHLSKVEDWLDENNSIFLELVNGKPYAIEKEKLYYVKLPNTNSENEYLYLAQGNISGDCWFNSRLERLDYESDAYKHQFTEKQIKNIDPRYWPFAVPVEESP